jgi:surface antigen
MKNGLYNKSCSFLLIFLSFLSFSLTAIADENLPRVDYIISEGETSIIFTGISPNDVSDVTFKGKSILEKMLTHTDSDIEYTEDGFIVRLNKEFQLYDTGELEVTMQDGDKHSLEVVNATASCKTCVNGIYNAVQCGSVKSTVGTPPYPCCDNNSNGKATDSGDGNCTWYAWYKAKKEKSWTVPSNWGAGGSWASKAANTSGWKVTSTPKEKTIGCNSKLGHVVWVTSVSSDKKKITVSEQNCKCPTACYGSGERTGVTYPASDWKFIYK